MPEIHLPGRSFNFLRFFRLGRYFFLVQYLIYPFKRSKRRLHGIYHKRQLCKRLRRLVDILEKRLENSYGHTSAKEHPSSENRYYYLAYPVYHSYARIDGVYHKVSPLGRFRHFFRGGMHAFRAVFFLIKRFYYHSSAVAFLNKSRHLSNRFLTFESRVKCLCGDYFRGVKSYSHKDYKYGRQCYAEPEHHNY